jgi:hypothetical protein
MRAAFVLTTVVLALALGIIAAASESRLLIRALVIGFVPAIWAVSHVLERLTAHDMWDFTAPYRYRWTRERAETALPRPNAVQKLVEDTVETNDRSAAVARLTRMQH